MTTETEAPTAVLEVAVCPGCGTLYRKTAERIWCPSCSTDATESFDLGGLIDAVRYISEGFDLLLEAFAKGLRVDAADLLDVLPKALETLVVPTQARPPADRPARGPRSTPHRPAAAEAPAAGPGAEEAQGGPQAAAAVPLEGGDGVSLESGSATAAAAQTDKE